MQQPIKLALVPGLRTHSGPTGADHAADESKFDDVQALQEETIAVTFILEDDSTISREFKKGHTVAVLKAFLSDECDLDVESTTLSLNGRQMLDPFSLTDFDSVVEASAIEVHVLQDHPHPRK